MKYWWAICIAVACLTPREVNDKICNSLCKKDYDGGYSRGGECYCYLNKGLIEDFEQGQIKIFRERPQSEPKPATPTRDWW